MKSDFLLLLCWISGTVLSLPQVVRIGKYGKPWLPSRRYVKFSHLSIENKLIKLHCVSIHPSHKEIESLRKARHPDSISLFTCC